MQNRSRLEAMFGRRTWKKACINRQHLQLSLFYEKRLTVDTMAQLYTYTLCSFELEKPCLQGGWEDADIHASRNMIGGSRCLQGSSFLNMV
jgi:hypothetical protein